LTKHFSQSENEPVGLLGVGLVGSALAGRLIAAGHALYAYDPVPEAIERLRSLGGRPAADEVEVARSCRRIVLSLPGPSEVCAAVSKLIGELRPGDIVIDTTTGDPETVERIARKLADRDVSYLDATLGGSSRQIAAGEAIVICGATDA